MNSRKLAILAVLAVGIFLPGLMNPVVVQADPIWDESYDGGADDWGRALIVKPGGATFTFGDTIDDATQQCNIVIQKRDTGGNLSWTQIWDNNNNRDDYVKAAAQLEAGGVIAVGSSLSLNDGLDWRILKYGGAGVFKWTQTYNGSEDLDDQAEDVAIDQGPDPDHIYVAGWSTEADGFVRLLLQKYTSDSSVPVWTREVRGVGTAYLSAPKPVHVAVDESGYIYLAGTVDDRYGHAKYYVARYLPSGTQWWSRTYGGSYGAELRDLVVESGYVYVTGSVTDAGAQKSMLTVKIAAVTGTTQWEVEDPYGDRDIIGDLVAVDSAGDVYVAGEDSSDWFLAKYGSDGSFTRWIILGGKIPHGMAIDGNGDVVVGVEDDTPSDYITYKFDPSLDTLWYDVYDGSGNGVDVPQALGVDDNRNIYITGYSDNGSDYDMVTLKYAP